jgi:hypothetical protein
MPINDFSVGRDLSLDIIDQSGNPLRFSLITDFKAKPDITDQKIKGLDGVTRHVRFPNGWTGNFSVERQDNTIDNYFADLESAYYAGINETSATITETISEVDGSVSQYKYVGVLLKLDDAGEYSGDKTVKQMVSFVASRREKVA